MARPVEELEKARELVRVQQCIGDVVAWPLALAREVPHLAEQQWLEHSVPSVVWQQPLMTKKWS